MGTRTPPRIKPSIKKDPILAKDYLKYKLPWACEDCVYFTGEQSGRCILGYLTEPHRREEQRKSFELSGRMALCRFLEME